MTKPADILGKLRENSFDILAVHHAEAILTHDMPKALAELYAVLCNVSIPIEDIIRGGGGEAASTQAMRRDLSDRGWNKRKVVIRKYVDDRETQSLTHEIDHFKEFDGSYFALEIEWNNKDPFFDRDLENFKRLHAEGAISVGGIITRGQSLQSSLLSAIRDYCKTREVGSIAQLEHLGYDPTNRQRSMLQSRLDKGDSFPEAFSKAFVSDKFGSATTHWNKLTARIERGVGNPCPLLLIGLPSAVIQS
jgi:hypothetical protein